MKIFASLTMQKPIPRGSTVYSRSDILDMPEGATRSEVMQRTQAKMPAEMEDAVVLFFCAERDAL